MAEKTTAQPESGLDRHTMGTMVALGAEGDPLDENGTPVSSNTSCIESAAGVGDGAHTGLASIVTEVCFLLATSSRRWSQSFGTRQRPRR